MMDAIIAELRRSSESRLCAPAGPDALRAIDRLPLPAAHKELLKRSNGIAVYHGYQRLFGVGCSGCTDLLRWNHEETWKFAWPMDLSRYLCFAEDGFGYQFAYDIEQLRRDGTSPVYWLAALTMEVEPWWDSFERFLERNVLRWLHDPYGSAEVAAYHKHGDLPWGEQIAYCPSLLLGGRDGDVEHTMKMRADVNMIINGDLFRQAGNELVERPVRAVEPYVDEKGRQRLRVIWGDTA
jgi:hypothetical protein